MGPAKTVLIVEDHEDFRELLAETLRLEGWTTVTASDSDDAVRVARTTKVHVVVADIRIPPTSGPALERTFRADPSLTTIPFVFMTGWAPHLDEVGHHRGFLKPFEVSELCKRLDLFIDAEDTPG
ncbi:MAG TPA: response regulator [Polyangia bacterium]|nr:response regulator [Polyangia bacterium]